MNAICIDDEELARRIIGQLVKKNPAVSLEAEFSNAIEAIKYLNKNRVDLIFLDIHMPDFNGFDLIQTLKHPPRIILTTSDKNFAIEAFEYECVVDYLVKPIAAERFDKAIQKALAFQPAAPPLRKSDVQGNQEGEKELYVNIDRRLIKIEFPSILVIEARGDYIYIKTTSKNYTVHSTLKKIEQKLPEHLFLKVHRSFIINTQKIIDIEDNSVLIEKEIIPVSRSNRSELMRRLNLL